jgi:hypothetical protein
MPKPENIEPHKFKKGQTGNPNGRPKKVINRLETLIGRKFDVQLTKADKMQIVESLLELSLDQLKAIATDKETPVFMVLIATAIRGDIERKNLTTANELLNRLYGKPGTPLTKEEGEVFKSPLLALMQKQA